MNNIIDFHVHLDVAVEEPISSLLEEMAENNVSKATLILNLPQEIQAFLRDYSDFRENKDRFYLAVMIDPSTTDWTDCCNKLKEENIPFFFKLHPRLSKITKGDFSFYFSLMQQWTYQGIIVDHFPYGSNLEYHVGTELSIYLAKQLPDKKIIIAHSGGIKLLEVMAFTRELKNIYYDISFTSNYYHNCSIGLDLIHFLKHTQDRILFGSDCPAIPMEEAIHIQRELCDRAFTSPV